LQPGAKPKLGFRDTDEALTGLIVGKLVKKKVLGFSKHIYATKTVNLKIFQESQGSC